MGLTEYKYEIEKAIVQILLTRLDAKEITLTNSSEIAEFCLEKLKTVASEDDLSNFVLLLVSQYPMFKDIATIEKAKKKEILDAKAVDEALDLAKNGDLDKALNVAKAATAN